MCKKKTYVNILNLDIYRNFKHKVTLLVFWGNKKRLELATKRGKSLTG